MSRMLSCPPILHMIELTVADWPMSVDWYQCVLGLSIVLRDEATHFALLEAGTARIAIKAGQPLPGSTLLTFEVADLTADLARLGSLGIAIESGTKHSTEGYQRLLLRDPDGHRLCLFAWTDPARKGLS